MRSTYKISSLLFISYLIFYSASALAATLSVSSTSFSNFLSTNGNIFYFSSNASNASAKVSTGTVTFSVSSPTAVNANSKIYIYVDQSNAKTVPQPNTGVSLLQATPVTAYTTTGATAAINTTFDTLCNDGAGAQAAVGGTGCGTDGYITVSIILHFNTSGITTTYDTGDEIYSFNFYVQSTIPADTTGNEGFYSFLAFPGDQKIHIKNSLASTDVPGSINNVGAQYIRFYYVQTTTAAAQTALNAITTSTPTYVQTSVSSSTTGALTLQSYYLQPLSNLSGTDTYCVVAAIVDNANNVGYLSATRDPTTMCAQPSEVAGLLSKSGNCFIATAAFGSPMASEVLTLRKFRDEVLLKSHSGQKFVKWYYKNSPPWADRIRENETAKSFVRAALWPAIGYSTLALKFGAANAALLFVTLLMFPLLFAQYYILRKKRPL